MGHKNIKFLKKIWFLYLIFLLFSTIFNTLPLTVSTIFYYFPTIFDKEGTIFKQFSTLFIKT